MQLISPFDSVLKQALWNMHWGRASFSTQFVPLHWAWCLAPFFLESSVFITVIMQHSTHIYFPIPQAKKLCKLNASATFVGSYAVLCLVTQSCLTLRNPMDCSLPGSSVHGILQARILEWVAFPFSPTQGSNPGLLRCRQIIYHLSYQGSPRILEWVAYPFSRDSYQLRNWTRVSCITSGFFINWGARGAPWVPIKEHTWRRT